MTGRRPRGRSAWRAAAKLLYFGFCAAAYCASDTLRQPIDDEETEPAYKVFYENGFYREAIGLLRMKMWEKPDTVNIEYLMYLAFCYAAGGWRDSATAVFRAIIEHDSTFRLDTITTSPKILDVFARADSLGRARRAAPSRPPDSSSIPVAKKTAAASPVSPPRHEMDPFHESQTKTVQPAPASIAWGRYALYCLPGGAGQFYRGHRISGTALLAIQVAGLTAGYWAYDKRRGLFDPVYGWTDKNRRPYENYSACSIGGFSVFVSVYLASVIENFFNNRKKTSPYPPRE